MINSEYSIASQVLAERGGSIDTQELLVMCKRTYTQSWENSLIRETHNRPAIFYSFSFCPNPKWTTFYPEGREIVTYLQGVCDKYEIVDKIQLNTDVRECTWLEDEQVWEVVLQHLLTGVGDLSEFDRAKKIREEGRQSVYVSEEKIRCKVLVSSVGGLVEPKVWPKSIPGNEKFEGEIFHSARWRYDVDFKTRMSLWSELDAVLLSLSHALRKIMVPNR